jgi:hypothetical protein
MLGISQKKQDAPSQCSGREGKDMFSHCYTNISAYAVASELQVEIQPGKGKWCADQLDVSKYDSMDQKLKHSGRAVVHSTSSKTAITNTGHTCASHELKGVGASSTDQQLVYRHRGAKYTSSLSSLV